MVKIRLAGTGLAGTGSVGRVEATLESGQWHCADARLKRLLNAMRAPWQTLEREWGEAAVVSKLLGAEIIES